MNCDRVLRMCSENVGHVRQPGVWYPLCYSLRSRCRYRVFPSGRGKALDGGGLTHWRFGLLSEVSISLYSRALVRVLSIASTRGVQTSTEFQEMLVSHLWLCSSSRAKERERARAANSKELDLDVCGLVFPDAGLGERRRQGERGERRSVDSRHRDKTPTTNGG